MTITLESHLRPMVKAFQTMAKRNDVLQDTHGNLSMRVDDEILIKPSGVPYDEIGPHEICQVKLLQNGSTIVTRDNGLKPSVDLVHHAEIYLKYPHIKAICHTHSPHTVAHAILGKDIDCLTTEQADYFGGDIKCYRYSDLDSWGKQLSHLEGKKAILLQSHGALTFADDPAEAVKLAIQLENVARKNVLAGCHLRAHTPSPLDTEEVFKWHRRYQNVYGQK